MPQLCIRTLILLLFPVALMAQQEILFNQINLDVQSERDVDNDQLEVLMQVDEEGNRPEDIASRVNEKMDWALELARGKKDIEVKTGTYQTYPVYNDRYIVNWRANQQLNLRSTNITALTELVGSLQEKLQVVQMSFSPTKATRTRIENELISEAMEAFRKRAELLKPHMDNMNYRIVNLNISTGQAGGPIMYREMAMAAKSSDAMMAPAVEAGTSKVVVTVSGSIQFY